MKTRTVYRVHLTLEKVAEVHDGKAWVHDLGESISEMEILSRKDKPAVEALYNKAIDILTDAGLEGELTEWETQ